MTEATTGLRVVASNTHPRPAWVVWRRPNGFKCLRCQNSMQIIGSNNVAQVLDATDKFFETHQKCTQP